MTRAKDNLHLIVPQRFFAHSQRNNGDRHMYAARTRFIPAEILKFFEGCAWPVASTEDTAQMSACAPVDIRAKPHVERMILNGGHHCVSVRLRER
jgi:DNA helicase II / ATP-dependent DNA helicase PcrA